ncbi:unnamed protein product [Polarella glacialis]|uniref:Rieske domain-containing protein n=1 Tax=Polarella glacialis TaxID=89957 RepID=A0A813LQN9_POLGL|nr:unnamed protein product [Polarella glacialis]|mmetsp:Transcript_85132/g.153329  ORF Transcript_85132/g.153329 Transcript_85132/m.153329 type:complete len:254 (+) Transcript_85132:95-856(+)
MVRRWRRCLLGPLFAAAVLSPLGSPYGVASFLADGLQVIGRSPRGSGRTSAALLASGGRIARSSAEDHSGRRSAEEAPSASAEAEAKMSCESRRSMSRSGALMAALLSASLLWPSGAMARKPPKTVVAQDSKFREVTLASWVIAAKGQPDLVVGLKTDPYFLLPGQNGGAVRNFAVNAECTHLGCLVTWSKARNRFVCPCHGSQYDEQGSVIKGPAPKSLGLAHVQLADSGKVQLAAWTEEDFRDGSDPWWMA